MKIKPHWLKLAAGILLLALLLTFQVRPADVVREFGQTQFRWILLAGALHIIGLLLSAYRWQLLLSAQKIEAPLTALVQSYLIGGFFNNFLPTRIGGDVYRVVDSKKYSGSLLRPFAVIFVERLTGIYGLLLIGICAVAFYPRFSEIKALAIALFVLAVAALAAILLFYGSPAFGGFLRHSVNRLPEQVASKVLALFDSFWYFSRSKVVVFNVFLLGLLLQLNVILYYYLIARGLAMPLSLLEASVVMPILICVQLLPLTPNGIGVREFSYVYLLAPFGVNRGLSVAFALWDYILTFFYGLIGGVLYLLKKS